MSLWTKTARSTLLIIAAAALLGWRMAELEPGPLNSASIAAYGGLCAVVLLLLWLTWKKFGSDRALGRIALTAFGLRLVIGVALSLLLPVIGYDEPAPNAGYIFRDALQRDTQAWQLAVSGAPLTSAFNSEFFSDQYGGMLITSAGLYRIFSPDMHRPWLILLLTASVSALGVMFLYRALDDQFGSKTAKLAAWIFALYPESVLLGAAQMRDPILIGLAAVAFYFTNRWRDLGWKTAVWLSLIMALLAGFSWLVALGVGALLAVWWWIDYSATLTDRRRRLMGWAFLVLLMIAGYSFAARWLQEPAAFEFGEALRNSGWIQELFKQMPENLHNPFIVVYGLAQPVLPAALIDPALPIASVISSFRSVGWYLMIPLLLYAPIALWKTNPGTVRRLLVCALVGVAVWTLISSLRAGGDLWDNPRYRTLFMPWLALVAAWAWYTAREHRDGWLVRWYLVMGIFLVFFTNWYLRRTFGLGIHIDFWPMVLAIVALSALVIGWGIVKEFRQRGNPFTRG
jgi:4-amino-4-deoxy-L-arabinose transferase-like glycosyltransferase